MFLLILKISSIKFKNKIVLYFFVQSLGRILLIFFLVLFFFFQGFCSLIVFILIFKIGLAPFQFWYFNILNLVSLNSIWILTVWIKILYIKFLVLLPCEKIRFFFAFFNVVIGTYILIKEKIVKMFLGVSSIFNMGWIILSLKIVRVWFIYLLIYSVNLFILIMWIRERKVDIIIDFQFQNSFFFSLFILWNILFLIGIPPFSGFLIKLLILAYLIKFSIFLGFLILIFTVVFIYFYLLLYFYFFRNFSLNLMFFGVEKKNFFWWRKFLFFNLISSYILILLF